MYMECWSNHHRREATVANATRLKCLPFMLHVKTSYAYVFFLDLFHTYPVLGFDLWWEATGVRNTNKHNLSCASNDLISLYSLGRVVRSDARPMSGLCPNHTARFRLG